MNSELITQESEVAKREKTGWDETFANMSKAEDLNLEEREIKVISSLGFGICLTNFMVMLLITHCSTSSFPWWGDRELKFLKQGGKKKEKENQ